MAESVGAPRGPSPFERLGRSPAIVIAEAGVNHDGDLDTAKALVLAAASAGADCVKFQTFRADRVVTRSSPKADYQLTGTDPAESQHEMLRSLELEESEFGELAEMCRQEGVEFLSTPYSHEDVDALERIGVGAYKIASGQLVEPDLLGHIAALGKPVILSTGMGSLAEVADAVDVIRAAGNERLVVLQCHTDYPSSVHDANIRAMVTMRDELDVAVGYSDHTLSHAAIAAATALGAVVIERHLTLSKTRPGPDHLCSSEPAELAQIVELIRGIEAALGSPVKSPTPRERENAPGMRRSLVARARIPAGTVLTREHFALKRPGDGLLGTRLDGLIGRVLGRDLEADEAIALDDLDAAEVRT